VRIAFLEWLRPCDVATIAMDDSVIKAKGKSPESDNHGQTGIAGSRLVDAALAKQRL
jgi:hypothetical protein